MIRINNSFSVSKPSANISNQLPLLKTDCQKRNKIGFAYIFKCILAVSAFPVLVIFSENAAMAASQSLQLCVSTVIPSLFPFLVISTLITSSGAGDVIGKLISVPFERIFIIDKSCAVLFLLGNLTGYPAGAAAAANLVMSGRTDKDSASRALAFCNNTGPAFLITGIGAGILSDKMLGLIIWIALLMTSVLCGILMKKPAVKIKSGDIPNSVYSTKAEEKLLTEEKIKKYTSGPDSKTKISNVSFAVLFTKAVSTSAVNMLSICAFVTFFGVVTSLLKVALLSIGCKSPAVISLITCFAEITSGVKEASSLGILPAALITAAAVGWSGLSVHFQTSSVIEGSGITMKYYYTGKIMSVLICPVLTLVLLKLTGKV